MEGLVARFKQGVIEAAHDRRFVHHRWFVEYHLVIVERIALELCDRYPAADRTLVTVLVWLHDYGKIVDHTGHREHEATLSAGGEKLLATGFPEPFVRRALACADSIDRKDDLENAPLEVRIVSSADGAAHLVGPFFKLWWHENAGKPFEELMADNARKALYDWQRKIVLPEVRAAFARRHRLLLEECGHFPPRFLDAPAGLPVHDDAGGPR
jgi:hypothetical protein